MNLEQINYQRTALKPFNSPNLKVRSIVPLLIAINLLVLILISLSSNSSYFSLWLLLIIALEFVAIVGLGMLLIRQLRKRVNQIIDITEQVGEGDWSVRIDDCHDDDIGRLARTFNEMIEKVDHLYHSHHLLSRTMSPAVRQSLMKEGLDFRGLTQEVSILFVDIRDFTTITEKHNTEQLVFFLNDYYATIANQVHSGGGIIGKFAGDSILAYFGAPNPEPASKSSTSALLTALALEEAIEELSQRWIYLGLPPIRVGIGLSIGEVVAGPIGSEQQFEYTVIGDVVNLASRLQGLTRSVPGYDIILSAEVYNALEQRIKDQVRVINLPEYEALSQNERSKNLMIFVDFGEVSVKGKQGLVRVFGVPS